MVLDDTSLVQTMLQHEFGFKEQLGTNLIKTFG